MSGLSLFFLGPPRIERDGVQIKIDTRKAIALLVYLAVTGESHWRDSLVNLLWPDYGQTRGRALLRQNLYNLNKVLPGDWLKIDRESVHLNPGADIWLDVDRFHRLLEEFRTHGHSASEVCPSCINPLTEALELYQDDFLSGFSLKDSFNFDDWQFFQTQNLRQELASVLERLVKCLGAKGEFEAAISYARRWLAFDRLHEEAHSHLMRLFAWAGQRSAALRQYEEYIRFLENRSGASPGDSITWLYETIKERRSPPPPEGQGFAPLEEEKEGKTPPKSKTPSTLLEEENRIVTVLFVGISGWANRSDMGPEDEASTVNRFIRVVEDILPKYGGGIDRFQGESLLALFGRTQTHESDHELAIRAAVEVRSEARKLGLNVSAGINTGRVYFGRIGSVEHPELTVMGAVVSLASRLYEKADAGGILVGESTYRHTRRAFEFTSLSLEIKGMDDPITAYKVERLLPQHKKALGIEGLKAKMIGRDKEFESLKEIAERLLSGEGQMVSIIGEAGIGKSRLVTELKEYLGGKGEIPNGSPPFQGGDKGGQSEILQLEGRCLEFGATASYWPFIDILRDYFAWGPEEDENKRANDLVSSLEEMVDLGDLSPERSSEIGPLLGNLLSLQFGNDWDARLKNTDPERIKHLTFMAIRDFFIALAKRGPILLVFEDLHWSDSLSLDLISLLMETLTLTPLLLLCIYRPEKENKCWHLGTIASGRCPERYTELHLRELTSDQSRLLVESLLKIGNLPPSVKELILERSQGNPFFVEEVVHSLIDSGLVYQEGDLWRAREGIEALSIPEGIQSVVLSRVDHLGEDLKNVLQRASVIGRLFRKKVLERVSKGETDLESALWELEDRALIYKERAIPEEEYSFKHVLTQEAVYDNIPKHRRQVIHRQVAEAMEILYHESLDEYYEQLAYHCDKSANVEKAMEYLLEAGEKAKRSYANEAAITHLTRGLELLKTTPETHERSQSELNFLIALGLSLFFNKGNAAPEVGRTYARARELCKQVGEPSQLFQVLLGLRRFYFARGELGKAHELGEELLVLAQSLQDPIHLSRAHFMLAETLHWRGEFASALEHCDQGISFYDPHQQRSQVFLYGTDSWVGCQSLKASALWHLGYPDQALERSHEAMTLSQEISHPFSLVYAIFNVALLHHFRREVDVIQERAEEVIGLAIEQGFPFWLAMGTALQGSVLAGQGETEEGIKQMHQSLVDWRTIGAEIYSPFLLALLAGAYGKAGRTEEGLGLLAEALAVAEKTGEREWEAELYRLKGELLVASSTSSKSREDIEAQSEECFHKAIDVAHQQEAKSWELRAAMSLGRLWSKRGKKEEARKLLGEIYGWFTEGFDTEDLKEAKALLENLS